MHFFHTCFSGKQIHIYCLQRKNTRMNLIILQGTVDLVNQSYFQVKTLSSPKWCYKQESYLYAHIFSTFKILKLHFQNFFQLDFWWNFCNFTITDTSNLQFPRNLQVSTRNAILTKFILPDSVYFFTKNFSGSRRLYRVLIYSQVSNFHIW